MLYTNAGFSVTVEQKIGQLLVLGTPESQMNHRLMSHLSSIKPGGIILFKRNIKSHKQVIELNKALHKLNDLNSEHPLFVMTDQEGGSVTRIHIENHSIPSAAELGQMNNYKLTASMGYFTGILLETLGFNMNLAPVVDLSGSYKNFIGSRSFGSDPNLVFNHAMAFSKAMKKYNVLSTLKLFPGHGNTEVDSHLETPEKSESLKELLSSDLFPFHLASKSKFPYVIMSSHIRLSNVDKSRMPATFSKKIINDLLIEKLKFNGLVITDDLLMQGTSIESVGRKAELALRAGNHLIMFAWSPKKQHEAFRYLVNLAHEDPQFLNIIEHRYNKVVAFKSSFLKSNEFWKRPTGAQIKKIGFIKSRLNHLLKKIKKYQSQKQALNF
ncbi:MAG: hypothetical protein MK008_00855 [Bdellovibrionales bacterium]|nr:hypothetical protein [Bdellovibrionales bacterium]